ncbi:MAG: hypothetical protein IJ217_04740 [Clostridia bacterium]|nr:hypothetical protein [Clostridia bacterium]
MESTIPEYIEQATIYGEELNEGNSQKANRAAKKIGQINHGIIEDGSYKQVVDALITSEIPSVLYLISSVCLQTGYRLEEAIGILKKMSEDESIGIISMNAYIAVTECER